MKINNLLIICNGEKPQKNKLKYILQETDFIICADGGANHAAKLNIVPDLIIGDMDSISEKTMEIFRKVKYIKDNDQESTDLEKALNYALKLKPSTVRIAASIGNRIDHSLTNLSILKKYHGDFKIEILTNYNILELITKPIELTGKIGQSLSIVPIGKLKKVKTEGLLYPLNNEDLEFGKRDGQSNKIISNPVKINFKSGEFFLITNF